MSDCNISGESERLKALYRLDVLDSKPEESFDRITRLAQSILRMPMVLISLVDRDRQWFKSRQGVAATEATRDNSFCTHTIRGAEPLIVNDAHVDPRFANSPLVVDEPHIRSYFGVPLRTREGYNVGMLCTMDTTVRQLSREQIDILRDLARLVVDELELRMVAAIDSLTGAMSRRYFRDQAKRDIAGARRHKTPLSCAVIDIDRFKSINDTHGHAAGDLALQRLVSICKSCLRRSDYVGRVGGDEFAAIFPDTPQASALEVAERLQYALSAEVIHLSSGNIRFTASIGIAAYTDPTKDLEDLLHRADQALYAAKSGGRNRVTCDEERLSILLDDILFAPLRA